MISPPEKASNVVIAESDDDDYLIFSIATQEISYKVLLTRAESGEMLLQLLNKEVPDILFLDLLLPGKSSRECLIEIRSDKRFDMLPVIIYTSVDDLKSIEFCYRQGSNLYVLKPNSIEALKDSLERIFAVNWRKSMYFPTKSDFVVRP